MYRPSGVIEASKILEKSKMFLIYYDPDIDGAISGELVRRFLTAFRQPYMYYLNENRVHGFKMTEEQVSRLSGFTMILVDASMSKEELVYLTSKGVNVINIDHHHRNEDSLLHVKDLVTGCEGVVINNQYPFEPEEYRFLSGAGVVYYVLNTWYPGFCGLDEKALVGLSLLSDIRPLESQLAREFLHTTFTHKSPMIEYLVQVTKNDVDYGFGVQTFDRNFIDYTFSPKINALFRLNRGEDAIKIFQGTFDPTIDLSVFRQIQNAIVDEIILHLRGEEYSNLIFKHVPIDLPLPYKYNITNFIGLACSRVKNFGKTTFLYVEENGRVVRGSVRGLCDDVDYLSLFRKYGFVCEGHKNAFGVTDVDFSKVDIQALNREIASLEEGYLARKYEGRVLEVNNLSFFVNSLNVFIADYNNYVRDSHRIYLKYTGSNVEKYQRKKSIEYIVDGMRVMCFDENLDFSEALILPLRERGNYVQFYLKRF